MIRAYVNPLSRYCLRRYVSSITAVWLVTLALFALIIGWQIVYQFSQFDLPQEFLLPSLLAQLPEVLLISLTIALYFGLIIALNGLNSSHERVIMQAIGLGYAWHVRRALLVMLPIAVLIAYLALVQQPQSLQVKKQALAAAQNQFNVKLQSNTLKTYGDNRNHELMIATDTFAEGQIEGMLMHWRQFDRSYLLSAQSGEEKRIDDEKWLFLRNVQVIEDAQTTTTISYFEELNISFEPFLQKSQPLQLPSNVRMQHWRQLLSSGSNVALGELLWRLSYVLNCLVFSVLAILLVAYRPRRQSALLFVVPLLYLLLYTQLLQLIRHQVEDNYWQASIAYGSFYALVALVMLLLWLYRQQRLRLLG